MYNVCNLRKDFVKIELSAKCLQIINIYIQNAHCHSSSSNFAWALKKLNIRRLTEKTARGKFSFTG